MTNKLDMFNKSQLKSNIPNIRSGDTLRVYVKVKEAGKGLPAGRQERIQAFEGLVIAIKHGKGSNATFTVRKISAGRGVERIFPFHSPMIDKIEIMRKSKVRRAKLYYMRKRTGKSARMRSEEFVSEEAIEENKENIKPASASSDEATAGK
jgi:large subunit ribosomal protein L19